LPRKPVPTEDDEARPVDDAGDVERVLRPPRCVDAVTRAVRHHDGRDVHHRDLGVPLAVARHEQRLVERPRRLVPEELRDVVVVRPDDDDAPHVLAPGLAPVPHVERVSRVVRVALPVHLDVRGVVGELLLVLLVHLDRVARLREHVVHELDVRSVVLLVELVGARMKHDHRAALLHERLAPVEVEQVPLRHHLHEQRVQERVHVVRADVRDARHEDVRLTLDRHEVLREASLERLLVHGLALAGEDARDAVGDGTRWKMAWRAACGSFESVKASALNDARSVPDQSSSFLCRNSRGRSNMRLFTVVSM
jgi:hypothetical protein